MYFLAESSGEHNILLSNQGRSFDQSLVTVWSQALFLDWSSQIGAFIDSGSFGLRFR